MCLSSTDEIAMEIVLGAIHMHPIPIKTRRRVMNGTECRMKMDKTNQIHGRAAVQTNGINIVKGLATTDHRDRNHRKCF